jgi:hypothetical protein
MVCHDLPRLSEMNSSVKNFMKDYLSTKLVPGKSPLFEDDDLSPINAIRRHCAKRYTLFRALANQTNYRT